MDNNTSEIFNLDLLRKRLKRAQPDLKHHDFLLTEAADNLAERLKDIKKKFSNVLELGYRHDGLYERVKDHVDHYSRASIIDTIPEADLTYSPEYLPFGDDQFDLILCNLHAHHLNDLPGFLIQIRRCLKKDGLLLMSLFGANSLTALRASLNHVGANDYNSAAPRLSPLVDIRDAGGLLQRAGFNLPVTDKEIITADYDNAFKLLVELRGMGETNVLKNQDRRIAPHDFFPKVCTHYHHEYATRDGKIPAQFEIIYLTGWKPDESQQKPLKPGSAKIGLSEALQTTEHKVS